MQYLTQDEIGILKNFCAVKKYLKDLKIPSYLHNGSFMREGGLMEIALKVCVYYEITFDAFMDYRVGGMELSAKGKVVIQKMLKGQECDLKSSNLSKREWNELMESFGFKEKIL